MKKISILVAIAMLFNLFTLGTYAINSIDIEKISETLNSYMELHPNELVSVGIFVEGLPNDLVNSEFEKNELMSRQEFVLNSDSAMTSADIKDYMRQSRQTYSSLYSRHNNDIAVEIGLQNDQVEYVSHYSPLIIAKMLPEDIRRIAMSAYVTYVELYLTETCGETASANTSAADTLAMEICRINEAKSTYNVSGDGVNIGIVDMGIPTASELSAAGISIPSSHMYGVTESSHAAHCTKIIHNIAPDAELFIAGGEDSNGDEIGVVECIEWVLDQEAMVISISMSVGGEQGTYTTYSKWMDHVSYQHFAMIVAASGNQKDGQTQCMDLQTAYNVITVGQLDCKDTLSYADDTLGIALYNTGTNVPFKPDLSGSYGDTSSSTAQVAGTIALLLERKPLLRAYSEIVKALLTASVNRSSPHRYVPSDRVSTRASFMQVGAGLLDAYNFITNGVNEAYYADVVYTTTVQDVITLPANKNVRLSLAYIQPVSVSSTNHSFVSSAVSGDIVNYQLWVIKQGDATPIAMSQTTNNLEIVDFNTGTGGNFTIRIVAVTGSTDDVFYSFAYDVY